MQFDVQTLLATLFVCNLLMAGALWGAFGRAFRASLRPWAGGLLAQAFAWLLLLAPHSVAGHASLVIAGMLLVYGCTLQLGAFLAFRNKAAPSWVVYSIPLGAFVGLTFWVDVGGTLPLSLIDNGLVLLAVQALTAGASFAFILMHQVHAHELATTDLVSGVRLRSDDPLLDHRVRNPPEPADIRA